MSTNGNKQKLLEQLRAEANLDRIKVSTACKDLIKFCEDNRAGDVLIVGWNAWPTKNPYVNKTFCATV